MGMLLSIPMILGGAFLIWRANRSSPAAARRRRREPRRMRMTTSTHRRRHPRERAHARLALHADVPARSARRLLRHAPRPSIATSPPRPKPRRSSANSRPVGRARVDARMGQPAPFHLIELGPGRGVDDGRRAARGASVPGFLDAARHRPRRSQPRPAPGTVATASRPHTIRALRRSRRRAARPVDHPRQRIPRLPRHPPVRARRSRLARAAGRPRPRRRTRLRRRPARRPARQRHRPSATRSKSPPRWKASPTPSPAASAAHPGRALFDRLRPRRPLARRHAARLSALAGRSHPSPIPARPTSPPMSTSPASPASANSEGLAVHGPVHAGHFLDPPRRARACANAWPRQPRPRRRNPRRGREAGLARPDGRALQGARLSPHGLKRRRVSDVVVSLT